MDQDKINLSKEGTSEEASLKFFDPQSAFRELRKRYDFQTNTIIGIFVVAFVMMAIMVGTLVIDSFHLNSAVYKEYSTRNEALDSMIEANKKLLLLSNEKQSVINDQKQIIEGLKKLQ